MSNTNTKYTLAGFTKEVRQLQEVATRLENNLKSSPRPDLGIKVEEQRDRSSRTQPFNLSQFITNLEGYIQWCEANSQITEAVLNNTGTTGAATMNAGTQSS
jgi:hypothetical protein